MRRLSKSVIAALLVPLVQVALTTATVLSAGLVGGMALSQPAAAADKVYVKSKLASGLEVIGMESHKVPLVTIVLAVKAGGMTESPDINGLTHLWEHMFFKGNKRLPDQEAFNKRIRELGIVFNGDTSAEKVRYYFTLPSAYLEEGLQFMADAIATPLLEQKELEKERRVVLDEYDRSAAQPSFDFRNLQRVLTYGDKGYLRDPLGLRPIIENATRAQLYRIKDEVFVPSNSALLVSGDFKPAALHGLVEKYFAAWQNPENWQPVRAPAFPKFTQSASFVMTRPNVQNAMVQTSYEGPKARAQPLDSFAADVLVNLLNHKSGKFYKKFVDSGLTYGAGLSYYTQSQAGELEFFAQTEPENAVKVQKMLLAEVTEMLKPDYFSKDQLADVARGLVINHKRELNQPSEFIKDLAFWWAVTGLDYYDDYVESLKKIGFDDVRGFIKTYLVGKPHLDGILLSPEDAKKAALADTATPLVDKYLTMYRTSQATNPATPIPVKK